MAPNSGRTQSSNHYAKFSPALLGKRPGRRSRKTNRSDDFKSRFADSLMEKKQELEEAIKHLENGQKEDISKESWDSYIDELDRTDREISAQSFYKLLDRKKRALNRIYILLDRIQHERDVGICEECGRQIPEERLFIIPEAVLCVSCQRLFEKLESRNNLSHKVNHYSLWREEGPPKDQDDLDDDGVIFQSNTDRFSLTELDEIELEDLPNERDDDEEDTDFPDAE